MQAELGWARFPADGRVPFALNVSSSLDTGLSREADSHLTQAQAQNITLPMSATADGTGWGNRLCLPGERCGGAAEAVEVGTLRQSNAPGFPEEVAVELTHGRGASPRWELRMQPAPPCSRVWLAQLPTSPVSLDLSGPPRP